MSVAAGASALPLAVVAPLSAAIVAPLVGRVSGRAAVVAGVTGLAASTGILAGVAPTVFSGRTLVHYLGGWAPTGGRALGVGFAADPFGMVFALSASGVGLLLLLYALAELRDLGGRELGNFACLFLLLDAGLIGAALTADLFNLFVWFEVSALASYALTAFFLERPLALEAAFKMLVLTTLASFAVFVGTALLYQALGGLNLAQLQASLDRAASPAVVVALGLLIGGYATKAGLVPFHAWLPDAHTAAPGPVSALFSGLMVNLGIVACGRLVFLVVDRSEIPVLGLLTAVGLASALLGAVMALFQDDLKRLLAFDTVSQMGVLALALGTGTRAGLAGAAYHLANHALFKPLLFLCAGAIVHTLGVERLSEMGGLARRKPALAAAFVVGIAAIVGVPPFNGYFSLTLIHEGVKEAHTGSLVAVLVVVEALTVAALVRAAWLAFFRRRDEPYEHERALAPGMVAGLVGLGALCVGFGLAAGPFVSEVAAPAAASLLDGAAYGAAVLSPPGGQLAVPALEPHFWSAAQLLPTAAALVVGVVLARAVVRGQQPWPITTLRALHNGSVNDYAAYVVGGLLVAISLLGLG
ncbi:MAG: Fe-S-binding domain-containing protein [Actinomycetota bacterium]|nr:Fe-S-binding domain-containing protein [Actinomycetota bacterium]